MLQITPSKRDSERLLVISPELADMLSMIMARIRGEQPDAPLVGVVRQERTHIQPAADAAVPVGESLGHFKRRKVARGDCGRS
jgi:hypothetical protein